MSTKIMKCLAMAALLAATLWQSSVSLRLVVGYVVTVGAIAVLVQAVRAGRYFWVFLFVAVAACLNPLLTAGLPYRMSVWLDLGSFAAFTVSLCALKAQPVLSIASITDRTPESESL